MNAESYFRYWGKAPLKSTDKLPYHLLPYHCLDVAAVGKQLLSEYPNLAEIFAGRLGIECETFCRYAVFLLALHDLGKFSETFQNCRPDLLKALQGRESRRDYPIRHDTLGFSLWRDDLYKRLTNRPRERRARGTNQSLDDRMAMIIVSATTSCNGSQEGFCHGR